MTVVWVTEKPQTARNLARALRIRGVRGGIYETDGGLVVPLQGHVVRPKMPEALDPKWRRWTTDPIIPATLEFEIDPGGAKVFHTAQRAVARASRVVVATDVGREGEAIGHQFLDFVGSKAPRDRCLLKSQTPGAIRRAIATLQPVEATLPRYFEAVERQYSDYAVGLTATRAANQALKPRGTRDTWHVGPVKSPVIAMLCDRERQIAAFVPRAYYSVALDAQVGGVPLTLTCEPEGEARYDKALADRIRTAALGASGPVTVERREDRPLPPVPFNIDSFLARMGAAGIPMKAASDALQSLYEDGYVTYPRTGATTWPFSAIGDAAGILAGLAGVREFASTAAAAAASPVIRKGLRYAPDKEHDALAPTEKIPNLAQLTPAARTAYLAVARNYIANHLPDAVDQVLTISRSVPVPGHGAVAFRTVLRQETATGWRAAVERDAAPKAPPLPAIADGAACKPVEARVGEHTTKPPQRYTPHGLVLGMARLIEQIDDPVLRKALANPEDPGQPKGLGTPATRKDIVAEIIKDGYAAFADGRGRGAGPLQATPKALAYLDAHRGIPTLAPLFDPVRRAELEQNLERIGSAPTVRDARLRADAWRTRLRDDVTAIAAAYAGARPGARYEEASRQRAPSKDMIGFARALAKQGGVALPRGYQSDFTVCKAFLDSRRPAALVATPTPKATPRRPPASRRGQERG